MSGGMLAKRNLALDGLRGLAVAAVLVYHVWPPWLPGGYLGVSVFFTLSGFLITTLLLDEWSRNGFVDARRFWARRARRLIPAALGALALAVVVTAVVGTADQLRTLGGDVSATATYVANWRYVVLGQSYGASYLEPSVLVHTWSLAIEEQFYLVLGLVAFFVARRARTLRPWGVVVGAIALLSLASTVWFARQGAGSHDRIYFGTDTRAFELAAGMALAIVLHARPLPSSRVTAWAGAIAGAIGLTGLTIASFTVGDRSPVLRQGGLVAVALLSTVVVASITVPGPLTRMLSIKPLVGLGVISYGLYLYHWPLLTLLSSDRVGLDGVALGTLQIAVSIALAIASYHLFESPIRHQRWNLPISRFAPAAFVVSAGIIVGAVAVSNLAADRAVAGAVDIALSAPAGGTLPATETLPTTETLPASEVLSAAESPSTVRPVPPLRTVLFLGDSLVHQGFPTMVDVLGSAGIDATAIGGPSENFLTNNGSWVNELETAIDRLDPDVVVLEGCCGQGLNQGADTDGVVPWAENPLMRIWEQRSIAATDVVTSRGKLALWVITPPSLHDTWYGDVESRMEVIRQFNLRLAACREGVGVVDWRVLANPDGSYAQALPARDGTMIEVRTRDKLHFTLPGQRLLAEVTHNAITRAWATFHRDGDPPPAGADCTAVLSS